MEKKKKKKEKTNVLQTNIYILNAFTEKPYSKLMSGNVITSSHSTSRNR